MFWADELAASASDRQVVNDSKTPSGTVHVGSLRGPVVVDTIARALRNAGREVELRYGVDDLDAMDAQALLTPDAIDRFMGVPLAHVPDPAGDCHTSYARHFAGIFVDTFDGLGIRPDTYYWMSEVYASGAMDRYLRRALDAAARIRDIYRRVANVDHPDEWHPAMVICESCGRIGTTIVTGWDRQREVVRYECRPDLRDWATGCGHAGEVSPFGGRAKLPYNVDWAAKWDLFGVTIEPAGKDLSTAGGSRDRSDAIAREVFGNEPPLNVPYEFLNIGGKKMSTSKGLGAAATRIADVIPPEQLRLLFLRPKPKAAIEFDPDRTDAIPRLFDESDRLAAATAGREVRGELPPHHDRVFTYSLVEPDADVAAEAAAYRPAFSHLALLEQIPGVDVVERVTAEKGSPLSQREAAIVEERRRAARAWLESYAPESVRLVVHETLPAAAASLAPDQRGFLWSLASAAESEPPVPGETWQEMMFAHADREIFPELTSRRAFEAIYLAFLGRPNGPRAGWLLASLDPRFVERRLFEAAGAEGEAAEREARAAAEARWTAEAITDGADTGQNA